MTKIYTPKDVSITIGGKPIAFDEMSYQSSGTYKITFDGEKWSSVFEQHRRTIESMLAVQYTGLAFIRTYRANPNPTKAIFLTEVQHGETVHRIHHGVGLHHLEGIPRDGDVVWRGGELWRVRR